jgi:C4-dicarboxylate transporter, DctQ subunit
MEQFIQKLDAVIKKPIGFLAFIGAAVLVFVWITVCADVLLRYFFNRPLSWPTDIASFALGAMTFFSAAWLLREEGHIHLDIVTNLLSPRTQAAFLTITSILGAILCLIITWFGAQAAFDAWRRGVKTLTAGAYPAGPVLCILPLGFLVFFLQFLVRSHKCLREWKAISKKKEKGEQTSV